VENGEEPDLGTQMLRIGGDLQEGLGHRPEQQAINQGLVLQGHRSQDMGQGEHDMVVGNWQQFGGALGQPELSCCPLALGTVPVQT
jgi:hypothetical protein